MKRATACLVLLLHFAFVFSQNALDNYYPIISSGTIPEDFKLNKKLRFEYQKQNLSVEEQKKLKKDKNLYPFLNAFSQRLIYHSGFVAFNDPISTYAEKVLDLLLKDHKELRSKIRIYLIKSASTNAFTTNDGAIFLSVGLMAQIQNEAHLAFVLAHEVAHYQKKHHLDGYLNLKSVLTNVDRSSSYDETLNSLFTYSKQQEFDADADAYENFYKNSGYCKNEIESLFDVLLYSYLPFDEVKFDVGIFESENYKFPESYILKDFHEITAIENYDDSQSTHPNILKRRESMLEKTLGTQKNGIKFLVSSDEFAVAQEIARFELSYLYRLTNKFEKAIYNSYLLMQKYPGNKFLKSNIAESLYGMAFYNNREDFEKVHVEAKNIEGYSQQVNHLFDKLSKDELNLLAIRYLWRLSRNYKNDKHLLQLTDSLIADACWALKTDLNDFPLEKASINEIKDSTVNFDDLSKTEKIKYRKKVDKLGGEGDRYYYHALIDLEDKSDLLARYEKLKTTNAAYYDNARKETSTDSKKSFRYSLRNMKFGEKLGIDKIVLLSPDFFNPIYSFSNSEIEKYFKMDDKVYQAIRSISTYLKLDITEFELDNSNATSVDAVNDYALFSSWVHELNYQNNLDYIPVTQKYVSEMAKKYQTNYFAWIGVNYKRNGTYELLVMDVNTNKIVAYYNQTMPKPAFDNLKQNIYNSLYRLKSK